ncbi:MAG: hypothetical protein ACO1OC_10145 [Tuberibacillus sp.]
MNTEVNSDLIISGSGSAGGGIYKNVEISGSGRVNGDIECERYKISGSAKIDGNVKTDSFKVSGSSHHYGNVEANHLDVSGSTNIDGHVAAKEMSVSGSCKIGKHLSGEKIEASGSIRVNESCAVELFKVKGSFEIGGMLNAETVDIKLYRDSRVKEIGGGVIDIKRGPKGFSLGKLFGAFNHFLSVDVIEGDDVFLENTRAKVVRGKNVHIGDGCEIGLVEYTNEFKQSGQTKIGEQKKI